MTKLTDFENYRTFLPSERHEQALGVVLDQVVAWSSAVAHLRTPVAA